MAERADVRLISKPGAEHLEIIGVSVNGHRIPGVAKVTVLGAPSERASVVVEIAATSIADSPANVAPSSEPHEHEGSKINCKVCGKPPNDPIHRTIANQGMSKSR